MTAVTNALLSLSPGINPVPVRGNGASGLFGEAGSRITREGAHHDRQSRTSEPSGKGRSRISCPIPQARSQAEPLLAGQLHPRLCRRWRPNLWFPHSRNCHPAKVLLLVRTFSRPQALQLHSGQTRIWSSWTRKR
jgi:hypothetical protein